MATIPPVMVRGAQVGDVIAHGPAPLQASPDAAVMPRYAVSDGCWTVGIGAAPHALGALPDACLTCAAKRKQDAQG